MRGGEGGKSAVGTGESRRNAGNGHTKRSATKKKSEERLGGIVLKVGKRGQRGGGATESGNAY